MKIIAVIDSFKGSMTSEQANQAVIDALPHHLLLAEMPSVLQHSTARAMKRRREWLDDMEEAGLRGGIGGGSTGESDQPEDQLDAELEYRLESIGVLVGASLAERYVSFTTRWRASGRAVA